MTATSRSRHSFPAPEVSPPDNPLRRWYAVMLVGGSLGAVTAAWQTVERIGYAGRPDPTSMCELNTVVSCNSVFDHWQSSALGIPNSLVALPVFALIGATGLAGLLGSRLSRAYLGSVLGVTLFMTAFIVWYLEQSAFAIGVLCLFCLGCGVSILVAGAGVTRVAAVEGAVGDGRLGRRLRAAADDGWDLVSWVALALVLAVMLLLGLAL